MSAESRGTTEQTKGAVKETAGKMMGDERLRIDGKADKAKGGRIRSRQT